MLKLNQLEEFAQLRHDLLDMDLIKSHPTNDQFLRIEQRIKRSLSPSIWQNFEIKKQLTGEYAIIMNNPANDRLMILLVLWPGQIQGAIHNHNTWSVVGVVRGLEENQVWNLQSATNDKFLGLDLVSSQQLRSGDVCVTSDKNIIHSVNNLAPGNQVSISIHVYGDDLRETNRHTFDPNNKTILSNTNEEFVSLDDFMNLEL